MQIVSILKNIEILFLVRRSETIRSLKFPKLSCSQPTNQVFVYFSSIFHLLIYYSQMNTKSLWPLHQWFTRKKERSYSWNPEAWVIRIKDAKQPVFFKQHFHCWIFVKFSTSDNQILKLKIGYSTKSSKWVQKLNVQSTKPH